jgi:hypothetical protein
MKYNPYGSRSLTFKGGEKMLEIISDKNIETVCGYDYFIGFDEWLNYFEDLVKENR